MRGMVSVGAQRVWVLAAPELTVALCKGKAVVSITMCCSRHSTRTQPQTDEGTMHRLRLLRWSVRQR